MAMNKVDKIWVDGEMVAWDDANEHVLAHTLHYGLGVFEGIRSYEQPDGSAAIFRLDEHIDRLFESAHICTLEVPYNRQQVSDACKEILRVNKLTSAYLRPIIYIGYGALGLGTMTNPTRTVVAAFEWGAYLGEEGLKKGIRCKVSGYRRGGVDAIMSKGKICGQYTTSILAKRDALKSGYDEAILLDQAGLVAEGSGENIFVVKNGVIRTPPQSASILAGITRDSAITIARDLGYEVREEQVTRDQLWIADEVFFTGTAAEVTPVREIDDRQIGSGEPGPITRRVQDHFFSIVEGKSDSHKEWLARV
jgi:branched-chain amino acid aminotransferase